MKKIILFIILIFITSISVFAQNDTTILPSQIGVVQQVEYVDLDNEINQVKQLAKVKITKGAAKGEILYLDNVLSGNPYYDINIKKGTKVILHVEDNGEGLEYSIEDIHRSNILLWLSLIFCGFLIYVGKQKGLCSLISIIITCFLIFNGLSPMILLGFNPVSASIIICLISTGITMYLVGGFNRKSTAATLGCIFSIIFAAILSLITVKVANLNGFTGEHSLFLYATHPELSFTSIAVSTMILATLGAVMDIGMSIASTINEIYTIDNTKTVKELFNSGMNVGKDIIGTMANTLILVYLGASLPLILLASNIDLQKFINLNQVVTEISSAIIGSITIVICVPITAIIASELIKNMPEKIDFSTIKE